MKFLNRLYLWSATRKLKALSKEIDSAREYQEDLMNTFFGYLNSVDYNRGDLAHDLNEIGRRIEALEDKRILTLARIAELKAKLNISV